MLPFVAHCMYREISDRVHSHMAKKYNKDKE